MSSIAALIAAGRKAFDDTAKAEVTRLAFLDGLVAAGFTYANTAAYTDKDVKAGKVSNEVKVHRDQMLLISAAAIKIKGKRLSDADLGKFGDDAVSNKVLLAGTAKGNISGETTWKGNATSFLGKVRKDLEARAMAGVAGTPRTPSTDADIILGYLQKAYTKTFKDAVDLKCDLADLQKELRALGKALGAELKAPAKK
jgi:hypothetical protein